MTIFTLYMMLVGVSPKFYINGDTMCRDAAAQIEKQSGAKYFKVLPEMYSINFEAFANSGVENYYVEKVSCAAKYSVKTPGETVVIVLEGAK